MGVARPGRAGRGVPVPLAVSSSAAVPLPVHLGWARWRLSGPASELPAPRPRRGAPGWETFRGSQAWPGGARPSLHFGLSSLRQATSGPEGRDREGDRQAGTPPPASPLRSRSVQKRDADCENRREGVGSFPSLIIAPACFFLHPYRVPAAARPRTRFHARV